MWPSLQTAGAAWPRAHRPASAFVSVEASSSQPGQGASASAPLRAHASPGQTDLTARSRLHPPTLPGHAPPPLSPLSCLHPGAGTFEMSHGLITVSSWSSRASRSLKIQAKAFTGSYEVTPTPRSPPPRLTIALPLRSLPPHACSV